jgi:hypothetical protein
MNRTTVRSVLTAALSLGTIATAHAVPLYFDFTGNIQDGSGTAIAGGFTLETDRLAGSAPTPAHRSWVDFEPANRVETVAQLAFGDRNITVPAGPGTSYVVINFFDGCTPAECSNQLFDNFGVFASTVDREIVPGFTGTYSSQNFYFASAGINRLPDAPFIEAFDYFDAAQVDPTSIVSLPLYDMIGFFSEDTFDCVDGACVSLGQGTSFSFTIDSVDRGVGSRSVPEPGTLGLLGGGLLAAYWMRRRQMPALAPRQQRA